MVPRLWYAYITLFKVPHHHLQSTHHPLQSMSGYDMSILPSSKYVNVYTWYAYSYSKGEATEEVLSRGHLNVSLCV